MTRTWRDYVLEALAGAARFDGVREVNLATELPNSGVE